MKKMMKYAAILIMMSVIGIFSQATEAKAEESVTIHGLNIRILDVEDRHVKTFLDIAKIIDYNLFAGEDIGVAEFGASDKITRGEVASWYYNCLEKATEPVSPKKAYKWLKMKMHEMSVAHPEHAEEIADIFTDGTGKTKSHKKYATHNFIRLCGKMLNYCYVKDGGFYGKEFDVYINEVDNLCIGQYWPDGTYSDTGFTDIYNVQWQNYRTSERYPSRIIALCEVIDSCTLIITRI